MIQKTITIFLFLMVLQAFYAQKWSLFIEPTISTKASVSSTNSRFFSNFTGASYGPFSIKNRAFIYPQEYSPILLGIKIGTVSKNKRNILSIGFNADESNSGYSYVYRGVEGFTEGWYNDGRGFTNIHLNYAFRLNKTAQQFDFYVHFAIGVGFHRQKGYGPYTGNDVEFSTGGGDHFLLKSNVNTPHKSTFLLSGGLDVDIKSGKGKYLFSLSLFYTHSSKVMSSIYMNVQTTGPKGNYGYGYMFFGRGSGLYFQISRRFQLFPWLIHRKHKKKSTSMK